MSHFLRLVLAFSLTVAGITASATSSHANVVSSGYSVSTSSAFIGSGGDYKFNVIITNSTAPGNIATCSVTIGYYLGLAKIGLQYTAVIGAWIPPGTTFRQSEDIRQSFLGYTPKVEVATCKTSTDTYIFNQDRSLAFIPSDQSQLEFSVIPLRGYVWGLNIVNKSQYPIYTRFEMTIWSTTANSDYFECTGANESMQWSSPPSLGERESTVGGNKYILIYPTGTHTNQNSMLEFSTFCQIDLSFGLTDPNSPATYLPINTFALMPPPPVAPQAPVAQLELTFAAKQKYAAKGIAKQLGVLVVSPKAKVSFNVAKASKKICTKSGSKLKTLKAGNCVVTFTVQEPKPKKGKKPKATKTKKTLIVR